jgi:osmotically-inducible protein OsmY
VKHIFLILLCAAAIWGADSKTTPVKPKPALPAQAGDVQQDKQIEAAIRAKLAKSKIGKDGLTVRVQGGVAFWSGSTNVLQHKGAATRMAKAAGARQVINNITVSDAAKQKAADNLTQGPRPAQLKRSDPRSQQ